MKTKSQKNVAFLFISLLLLPLFWEQNPLGVVQAQSNDSKTIAATNNNKKDSIITLKKEILLFINPNGRPCQIQVSTIEKMKLKLDPLAKVTIIKTTESKDYPLFQKYGIRGLPSLIILDSNGKEVHRFTPGIQEENTILTVLAQK